MRGVFSPCDRNYLELLEMFYEQTISEEKWDLALELGLKLLTGYRRLYPVYDVNVVLMLLKIGKLSWLVLVWVLGPTFYECFVPTFFLSAFGHEKPTFRCSKNSPCKNEPAMRRVGNDTFSCLFFFISV